MPPAETASQPPPTMAQRFYTLSAENSIDPSVGFILQIPPHMQSTNDAFGRLQSLCTASGIRTDGAFFGDLDRLIAANGIQPVTPAAFVATSKKAPTLQLYHEVRAQWGIHIPYFFQTCPGSAFYIYRTSADALLEVATILAERTVILTKKVDGSRNPLDVYWILEHIVDGNPCYALFDLDDYPHMYQGRLTNEEIKALMIRQFPANFSLLLLLSGCLDEEAVIEVRLKDRSRWDQEKLMEKMSNHLIFSVFAERDTHRRATAACLQRPTCDGGTTIGAWLKDTKKAASKAKSYAGVPTEVLTARDSLAWLLALDTAVLPGCPNGITTFFSKKNSTDPSPVLAFTTGVCLGMATSVQQCPYPPPHDIRSKLLTQAQKLLMLSEMSFTIPKKTMTFYSHAHLSKCYAPAGSQDAQVRLFKLTLIICVSCRGVEPRLGIQHARVNPDARHVGGG